MRLWKVIMDQNNLTREPASEPTTYYKHQIPTEEPISEEQQKDSFLSNTLQVLKGAIKGPAQLGANIGDVIMDRKEGDFTKFYSNPYEKIGSDIGTAVSATAIGASAGAAAGTMVFPVVGTAIGGVIGGIAGAAGSGFALPTDEQNIAGTIQGWIGNEGKVASTVWSALDRWSHKPGDTVMDKRYKNLFAEGSLELATGIAAKGVSKAAEGAVDYFKGVRAKKAAEKLVSNIDSKITEAEKAAPIGGAADQVPRTRQEVLNEEIQKDTLERAKTMEPEVQKTGRQVDENDVLSTHEIEYEQRMKAKGPVEKLEAYDDESLIRASDEQVNEAVGNLDKEFNATNLDATNPEFNRAAKEARKATMAAQNAVKEINGNKTVSYTEVQAKAIEFASDDNYIRQALTDMREGKQVSLEQMAALDIRNSKNLLDYPHLENIANGTATPEQYLKFAEMSGPFEMEVAEAVAGNAKRAGTDLGYLAFEANYMKALPDAPVTPRARLAAINDVLKQAGVKEATQADAVQVQIFVKELEAKAGVVKEPVKTFDDVLGGVKAEVAAQVEKEAKAIKEAGTSKANLKDPIAEAEKRVKDRLKKSVQGVDKDLTPARKIQEIKKILKENGISGVSDQDALDMFKSVNGRDVQRADMILSTLDAKTAKKVTDATSRINSATKASQLQELNKAMARAPGNGVGAAIIGYRTANILLSFKTAWRVTAAAPSELAANAAKNFLEIPVARFMHRDMSAAQASKAKALAHSKALFENLQGAWSASKEAWSTYKPGEMNEFIDRRGKGGKFIKEQEAKGLEYAKQELSMGQDEDTVRTMSVLGGTIKNGAWSIVDSGRRYLYTMDAAVSHLARESHIAGEAAYAAERMGLNAEEARKFIDDPPADFISRVLPEANLAADKVAYRAQLDNEALKYLDKSIQKSTFFKFLAPFSKSAFNSLERTAEYLPGFNRMLPSVAEAYRQGGKASIDATAKAATGSMALASAMVLYRSDFITGPSEDHKVFDDNGQRVPPYHFKVAGKYVPIESVLGGGIASKYFRMAGALDSAIDHIEHDHYGKAASAALFGMMENTGYVDSVGFFTAITELGKNLTRAKTDTGVTEVLAKFTADYAKQFAPGFRAIGEVRSFMDEYERERVAPGRGLEYVSNYLGNSLKEVYSPASMPIKPNYFGEPVERSKTFFAITDQYSPVNMDDPAATTLKVLRDLNDFGDAYSDGNPDGYHSLVVTDFSKVIKDFGPNNREEIGTGEMIRLSPSLFSKYAKFVSGVDENGDPISGSTFKEDMQEVLKKHEDTLKEYYKTGRMDDKDAYNEMVFDINALNKAAHTRARNLIKYDPEFKQLVIDQIEKRKGE